MTVYSNCMLNVTYNLRYEMAMTLFPRWLSSAVAVGSSVRCG